MDDLRKIDADLIINELERKQKQLRNVKDENFDIMMS